MSELITIVCVWAALNVLLFAGGGGARRAAQAEGGAAVKAVATYLLGAFGGWCLRMIWDAFKWYRRERAKRT